VHTIVSSKPTCSAAHRKARGAKKTAARRIGENTRTVAAVAIHGGPSVDFSGYWQRHIKDVQQQPN
jgi:hypothetical protein